MTDQHTPGPWRIQATIYSRQPQIVNEHGAFVADTDKHNARLIAAAPELLDALEALMVTIDAQINAGLRWDPEEVAATRAAIAKARGTP